MGWQYKPLKYQSKIDAVKMVSGSGLKGFKAKNILILTNQPPKNLQKLTNVTIASRSLPDDENEGDEAMLLFSVNMKRL